jgi:hypothetical protein
MRIDILHVPDCPNLPLARSRLREALECAGMDAAVRAVEVDTPEQANQVGMHGSPTILLGGRDPFGGVEASLACRLYPDGDKLDGAPTVAALIDALSTQGGGASS